MLSTILHSSCQSNGVYPPMFQKIFFCFLRYRYRKPRLNFLFYQYSRTVLVVKLQRVFIQPINTFDRSADSVFPRHCKYGIFRKYLHMTVQTRTRNIRQRSADFLNRSRFANKQILKNSLPNRIHYRFCHFHTLLSLLVSFSVFIISSFLRMLSVFYFLPQKVIIPTNRPNRFWFLSFRLQIFVPF